MKKHDVQNEELKSQIDSEENIRTILEHSTNMFYSHTVDHLLTYVSPQCKDIFGYDQDELLIKWTELATDNPINTIAFDLTNKAIETGIAQEPFELELRRKDGEIIYVEAHEGPVIKNGKVVAITGSLTNITKRKNFELALIKSEENFRGFFENNPSPTFVWELIEKDYRLVSVNNAAQIMTNNKAMEYIGASASSLYPDMPDLIKKMDECKENQSIIEFENHYKNRNSGTWDWINFRLAYIDTGQILMFSDLITKRKEAEEQLVKAKEKAEESDRLKSAFLANMSHEIRTPMNGIMGFTHLLKRPDLSGERQKEFIDIIQRSGRRMLDTVNNIVEISKMETGQIEAEYAVIDLDETFNYLLEFFKPEADQKNILIIRNCKTKQCLDSFKTDKSMFESVMINLLKNSIKYTHEGKIEFGCIDNSKGNEVEFYVTDTGIGIAKERQEDVFERFIQADIEDKDNYEGSGLGLSIAKGYVETLGGRIWVESEEGVGSTFHFRLPIIK